LKEKEYLTADISNFNLHEITSGQIAADKDENFSPLDPARRGTGKNYHCLDQRRAGLHE